MRFPDDLDTVLRDKLARGILNVSDLVTLTVRRDGASLFKTCYLLGDVALDGPDFPEADADGIPTSERHRAALLALAESGPLTVEALARILHLKHHSRLYDPPDSFRDLLTMGLVERGPGGFRLTDKGRRVASLIQAEQDQAR